MCTSILVMGIFMGVPSVGLNGKSMRELGWDIQGYGPSGHLWLLTKELKPVPSRGPLSDYKASLHSRTPQYPIIVTSELPTGPL